MDHLSVIEVIDHFPLDALIGQVKQDGADQQDKRHKQDEFPVACNKMVCLSLHDAGFLM
jgi:hypothetical protein